MPRASRRLSSGSTSRQHSYPAQDTCQCPGAGGVPARSKNLKVLSRSTRTLTVSRSTLTVTVRHLALQAGRGCRYWAQPEAGNHCERTVPLRPQLAADVSGVEQLLGAQQREGLLGGDSDTPGLPDQPSRLGYAFIQVSFWSIANRDNRQ